MAADKPNVSQFSNKPLYVQLRDALAERISKEEWKPGAPLPNESDLAREMGVSPGTMRKALDLLESDRVITRRQGRGSYVNDQTTNALALRFTNVRGSDGNRIVDAVASSAISLGEASVLEAERLRLHEKAPVYRIRRVRTIKERPYMVDETVMPARIFPGLSEKDNLSHRISVVLGEYGLLPGRSEERASIANATASVARSLGLKEEGPVLVLDRVVYSLGGDAVEWRLGYCHLVDEYYMAEMS